MNLRDEIKKALLLMETVLRFPKSVNKDLLDVWTAVLDRAGVEAEDVSASAEDYMRTQSEFPVPADMVKLCLERKRQRAWQIRSKELQAELEDYRLLPKATPALEAPSLRIEKAEYQEPTEEERLAAEERKAENLRKLQEAEAVEG